jgi:hypothetical protein
VVDRSLEQPGLVAVGVVQAARAQTGDLLEPGHRHPGIALAPEGVHGGGENSVLVEGAGAGHGRIME